MSGQINPVVEFNGRHYGLICASINVIPVWWYRTITARGVMCVRVLLLYAYAKMRKSDIKNLFFVSDHDIVFNSGISNTPFFYYCSVLCGKTWIHIYLKSKISFSEKSISHLNLGFIFFHLDPRSLFLESIAKGSEGPFCARTQEIYTSFFCKNPLLLCETNKWNLFPSQILYIVVL